MLMKTNGGNLSVLGMSLACRGREMQWHKKKIERVTFEEGQENKVSSSKCLKCQNHISCRLTLLKKNPTTIFWAALQNTSLKLDRKVIRHSSHETQLLRQLMRDFAILYHRATFGCGNKSHSCRVVFEDRVCHKVKQHNYTGPITHSI